MFFKTGRNIFKKDVFLQKMFYHINIIKENRLNDWCINNGELELK